MDIFEHTMLAMDRIFDVSSKVRSNPGTVQASLPQKDSPCDDARTAGVVDSNYDGAVYCTGCGAKAAQWCDCGPIASNE